MIKTVNTPIGELAYVDEHTLGSTDGRSFDVMQAIDGLPWVRQWCPFMPHQYAILAKSLPEAWYVVEAMIRLSPNSYRAFFRGYERANRYWEAPDGKRYWRSFYEIDRWDADDDHGLRRVNAGAKKVTGWDGPRHAPNGEGYYVQASNGRWYPSPKFFAEGHKACLGCGRPPPDVRALVGTEDYRVVDPTSADGAE